MPFEPTTWFERARNPRVGRQLDRQGVYFLRNVLSLVIWSTLQYRSCDAQTQFAAEQIRAAFEECVCSCLYLSVNSVYSFLHCFPCPCSSHGVPEPVNKVDISSSGLDYCVYIAPVRPLP
jgi:hypothetical protein